MMVRRVLVVAAMLAATTSLAPGASAPALAEDCTDGVIVVVDASEIGGGISERCVAGAPGTGLQALTAAGHDYTFVPRQPGLVCTIDARPDQCNGAPVDAYWSYWHADQGGDWRYSNRGAGNRSPQPGTVEGWRFGSGSPPGIAPPDGSPEPEPEPDPEPEPEQPEEPAEEPPSGSDGSGGSGGSGSGNTRSGSGDTASGSGDTASGSSSGSNDAGSGASSDAGSGEDASTASDESDDEPADERDEGPAGGRGVEPAELDPEVPVDGTADARIGDREEAPRADEPGGAEDTTPDDTVALPARDDDGVPIGLVTGGGLIAGLAGLTAFQVRRRRLED